MPSNTTRGYPIPLDSDPFADNTKAIRNLADKLNSMLGARFTANVSVSVSASGTGTAVLLFPAGRFDAPPRVQVTVQGASTYYPYVSAKTKDQVTVGVRHFDNVSGTTTVSVDVAAELQ